MPAPASSQPTSLHEPQDEGGTVLLIIDMVSTWDYPDAAPMLRGAVAIAPAIARLKSRCRAAGVPVVYANDNQGRWRSDWHGLMHDAIAAGGAGAGIARQLAPDDDDYFVLKPMHSAFFATPLQLLLESLRARRLLLTGVSADQCVLATAQAAHMHRYEMVAPRDAIAAPTPHRTRAVLRYFDDVLQLRTTPAARIRLQGHAAPSERRRRRT